MDAGTGKNLPPQYALPRTFLSGPRALPPYCLHLGGNGLIALLTGLEEVRTTAAQYLPWMVVMPLIAVWSHLLDGVFIGTTAVREMRNSIFIGLAVYLPAWWFAQGLGNHGLWLAFMLFMLVFARRC